MLPVWLLLAPRDYLSTFMKVGTIMLLAVGIVIAQPVVQMPAVTSFAIEGNGPAFAGSLFPFLFITIACGALSGFHALICSGTTPKMIEKESQIRMIGYGAMLTESFVAIMALVTAVILDQHLYFGMNAPLGLTGGTAGDRGRLRQRAGPGRHRRHAGPVQPGRGRRRRGVDHLPHRRRADPGVRHVAGAQRRARRRSG